MEEKLDLRVQKTHLALRSAFMFLLEEKRFEDITVNELCNRAMIRRTTFYKHFADKYEYFAFYIRELVSNFQDQLGPDVREGDTRTYLLHMSREIVRFMKQHQQLVENIKNSAVFPMLLSILLDQISSDVTMVLSRTRQDKMDRRQIDDIAAFYAGGIANALFRYVKQGFPIDEEQFFQTISRLMPSGE